MTRLHEVELQCPPYGAGYRLGADRRQMLASRPRCPRCQAVWALVPGRIVITASLAVSQTSQGLSRSRFGVSGVLNVVYKVIEVSKARQQALGNQASTPAPGMRGARIGVAWTGLEDLR